MFDYVIEKKDGFFWLKVQGTIVGGLVSRFIDEPQHGLRSRGYEYFTSIPGDELWIKLDLLKKLQAQYLAG